MMLRKINFVIHEVEGNLQHHLEKNAVHIVKNIMYLLRNTRCTVTFTMYVANNNFTLHLVKTPAKF